MHLAQFTKLVLDWKTANSYEDLMVDQIVLGEDLSHDIAGHLVEDGEHSLRLFCKPDCEGWQLAGQVSEIDLKGLFVPLAHALNTVLVYILTSCWVSKLLEEFLELPGDEVPDLLLLDPLGERPFRVCVVIQPAEVVVSAMFSFLAISVIPRTLHHAQLLLTDHSSFFVFIRLFIIHKGSSLPSPACSL